MTDLHATERVIPNENTCAVNGTIRWQPIKSLWYFTHMAAGLAGVVLFPHWDAAFVFIVLCGITICAGHSVGMHRLLIHRSFDVPRGIEYLLVWLGTLVGMAGPFGMIRAHDMRDWHQRQTICPPHPSHGAGFWRDAWWQMHCHFPLENPPEFIIEPRSATSRFYQLVEATWMLQQLPFALILYALGGWAWVLWGISLRIWVSLTGHWIIGHYAHKGGHQGWHIAGLPVQGFNLRGFGMLTFGESWHGNHHAFPHSAKLGIEAGQSDPGFWFIRILEWLGLAENIRLPASEAPRAGLTRVHGNFGVEEHLTGNETPNWVRP